MVVVVVAVAVVVVVAKRRGNRGSRHHICCALHCKAASSHALKPIRPNPAGPGARIATTDYARLARRPHHCLSAPRLDDSNDREHGRFPAPALKLHADIGCPINTCISPPGCIITLYAEAASTEVRLPSADIFTGDEQLAVPGPRATCAW